MGPSHDIRFYNGCIIDGVRFYTVEHDSRCTTQNSEVMVISESTGSGCGDNNFYGVLDEVLDIQYLMGRRVWLFKYRWFDTNNNKSHRTYYVIISSSFEEIDAMFLEFGDKFNNTEDRPY
ncbi:uncharacterized protein E6C27_scaffold40G001710 [Cucumis melo var. makuwa]|uniref:Uncharacterized protein n=1 Tax=Cucumis melo var. makuwa TaxID=1194695 RepID=A0A5A7VLW5_CUCMM|nr:uncharacterized protein E6C27_scaffold40G001710 [Cucumis melo var. makuwa]